MKNQLYVTTAIPYVNAKPHVGNAIDYLIADIWARYRRHTHQVRFQIGTDEHGNKIAQKAEQAGLEPQAYVDENYRNFQNLAEALNISYTDFVRTTDAHHVGATQYIWKQLEPYLYKGEYEGWYCQGCEGFVTAAEAAANGGVCPDHKTPYEHLKEENYYFKASAFSEQIKQAIESGKFQIVPEMRKNEILALLETGLADVSVSRPRKNLSWGISVPGDPDQVMYVWIDALANYLTVIGYPDKPEWQEVWPANLQVIGKDILRFHAGIWPAMLLALGLPLPKKLLVHGHVMVGGSKMSKTIGNVIDPFDVIDQYGVDAFRYFFARHIPTQEDGDFTWARFEMAYNTELANDFGNLISRVAGMINRYQAGVIGELSTTGGHDEQVYIQAMQNLNFNQALDEVWSTIRGANRYIDTVKPWEIAKRIEQNDVEAQGHMTEVLTYLVRSILQINAMIEPFLPETYQKIQDIFASGVVQLPPEPLFPKIIHHTKKPEEESPVLSAPQSDELPAATNPQDNQELN